MEQIKELLNILSETPEMALWGLGIYFTFYLAKMASWITALAYILKLFINRYFDNKEEHNKIKREELSQSKAVEVLDYFNRNKIGSLEQGGLMKLLDAIKSDHLSFIHQDDLNNAINAIKESKTKK